MGYTSIFQKLDKDITNQIQSLQAKQKKLLEKKKNLLTTKQQIQNFLNSAEEIKKVIETEPELMKSLRSELGQIFSLNSQPKLLLNKEENLTPNLEQTAIETTPKQDKNNAKKTEEIVLDELVLNEVEVDESIKDFKFVDAQGNNKSL